MRKSFASFLRNLVCAREGGEEAWGQGREKGGAEARCRSEMTRERAEARDEGTPLPDGIEVSLGLSAGLRAEGAHFLRAHLRGVPQGQVLHHRAANTANAVDYRS